MCISLLPEGMCVQRVNACCLWRTKESIGAPETGVGGEWAGNQIQVLYKANNNAINIWVILQPHKSTLCVLIQIPTKNNDRTPGLLTRDNKNQMTVFYQVRG